MLDVVSTRQFQPRDRLEYWNDLIGTTYNGMVVDAAHDSFGARLSVWQLAKLRMVRPHSSPARITRHERQHSSRTSQTYVVHIVAMGQAKLEQRGRTAIVEDGDMVICAAEEYYRFDAPTTHEMMVVEIDGASLASRIPGIEDYVARAIPGKLPGTRLLQRYTNSLWQEARETMPEEHCRLHANILMDMIVSCVEASEVELAHVGDPMLRRIEEVIAEQQDDFDFGPGSLAADLGVPLRTLQAVAARAGTTISQLIVARRLQKAARLLDSKPSASITDIALDCGFSDPSYFTRRFQQAFGTSPRRYRSCN